MRLRCKSKVLNKKEDWEKDQKDNQQYVNIRG